MTAKKTKSRAKKVEFIKQSTWLGLAYVPGDVIEEKMFTKEMIEKLFKYEIIKQV